MSESKVLNESLEKIRDSFSFLTDWIDLGHLICRILKINVEEISKSDFKIDELIVKTGLTLNEIVFIKGMIGVIDIDKSISSKVLNSDIALNKIKEITSDLDELLQKSPEPLAIAFLFNTSSIKTHKIIGKTSVFNAVQHILHEKHSIYLKEDDFSDLLEFINKDIKESSLTKISNNGSDDEYLLIVSQLTYVISKNKISRQDLDGHWDVAFCHSAYLSQPKNINPRNRKIKIQRYIQCVIHTNKSELQRINPHPWNEYIDNLNLPYEKDEIAKDLTTGFAAYHLTEIAFAKAEIYPIEVVSYDLDEDDPSLYNVKLRTRIDPEAETVSESLSIKSPAVRLKKIFTENGEYSRWMFLSNSNFNDEDHEIVLDFLSKQSKDGDVIYEFTTSIPNPDFKSPFIITSSTQGTISQLSRRAAAIDALSQHDELISLLKSPHKWITNSSENLILHKSFEELDSSKRDVFKNVMNTLPLYLVQGPPGVGKTYLVTTLVQQVFSSEPNSRLLLTAQSHSTVHHLFNEVNKALDKEHPENNPLLIISCVKSGSHDDDVDPNLKVDELARENIENLISSELFRRCPSESTKSRVHSLNSIGNRSGRSTLVNQLLKSANLVFATTNSKQVEGLIKSRTQFDWSIMEETGKVTGLELLSPMLLSHRRLMIGDHKQLPPYASEVMRKALGNTDNLKKALLFSQDIYNNNIKGEFVKKKLGQEALDSFTDQDYIDICNEALRLHLLFETLINEEETALKSSSKYYGDAKKHKPVASMLEIQHRMHPVIADVVSEVFYNKKLSTSLVKKDFYTKNNKPFHFDTSSEIAINSTPIVWIETPDVQANKGTQSGDRMPQWNNPFEAQIVVELIKMLNVKAGVTKPPKLALLSPYNKQIEKISNLIDREVIKGLNLDSFIDLPPVLDTTFS
ncbi:AAA domain-containing protein [Pantoea endophytica]